MNLPHGALADLADIAHRTCAKMRAKDAKAAITEVSDALTYGVTGLVFVLLALAECASEGAVIGATNGDPECLRLGWFVEIDDSRHRDCRHAAWAVRMAGYSLSGNRVEFAAGVIAHLSEAVDYLSQPPDVVDLEVERSHTNDLVCALHHYLSVIQSIIVGLPDDIYAQLFRAPRGSARAAGDSKVAGMLKRIDIQ